MLEDNGEGLLAHVDPEEPADVVDRLVVLIVALKLNLSSLAT